MELLYKEITDIVLRAFYDVYNVLGYGFLERVYENALLYELTSRGLNCKSQYPVDVYYRDIKVGQYFADIIVNDCVILELKAAEYICKDHEYQLINYLKASEIEVGLLLNFGKEPSYKRKVFSITNNK